MIVVDKVTKYYGSHCAVRDLDFRIEQGECVGFLGLNGAGKSTTLRLLSCLLLPTSGRVTVRGLDVEDSPNEIRKLIGYLPDVPPLYSEMRVTKYLAFAGQLRGMSGSEVKERIPEVLAICGLREVASNVIATLSHGYRQRVGIAQAIVHKPSLLILDEPLQGLDPMQIVEMRAMIRALRGRHTILLSTHMLSEIEQTCDRILMMHDGRIAAEGTEDQLAARYGGGSSIELEVRGAEEAVRAALAAIEGAPSLAVTSSAADVLKVRMESEKDVRAEVSRAVVGAGLDLLGMRRVSSGLESIFVRLSRERGAAANDANETERAATEPAPSAPEDAPKEPPPPSDPSSDGDAA